MFSGAPLRQQFMSKQAVAQMATSNCRQQQLQTNTQMKASKTPVTFDKIKNKITKQDNIKTKSHLNSAQ